MSRARALLRRGLDYDLAAACLLVLLAVVLAVIPAPAWLRSLVALPLVLLCPGYALVRALFPPRFVSRDERGIYTVAFTIAGLALGGLLLQVLFPLHRAAWLVLLLLLTWGGAAAATLRWPTRRERREAVSAWPRPPMVAVVGGLAAVALAVAAVAVGSAGEDRQFASAHFNSLWIVPADQEEAAAGQLRVGVESEQDREFEYHLQVGSGAEVESQWSFTLAPGESWSHTFSPPPGRLGRRIFASLYRGEQLYRRVAIEIGASE